MNTNLLQDLNDLNNYETNLLLTVFSFFLCIIFALYIKFFFSRYSKSISSKNQVAQALPLISSITFFIIVTVKSSLALSLGLIGALSIVRFRAPIKEPEELAYIFMAVAIGIGFGSGKIFISATILSLILIFMHLYYYKQGRDFIDYNLNIEFDKDVIINKYQTVDNFLNELEKIIKSETKTANFIKINISSKSSDDEDQLYSKSQIFFNVTFENSEMIKNLSEKFANLSINFSIFENKNIF